MSKQRHRRRSQGETTPETTPQTGSEVAHFSVSEVVQFSMSVDKETNQISSVRPRGRNTLPSLDSSDKMELVASSHGR
jgi:hypothetical protein